MEPVAQSPPQPLSVPLAEAKNRLSALVARVEQGEEIAITRRGVAVVRLVPESRREPSASNRVERIDHTLSQLKALRADLSLEGDLKTMAREGLA
jgi:prevent-host-death family protein